MEEETCPFTMLTFREFPPPAIWRFGMAGGDGMPLGSPPSKVRVNVALSPTVIVSRSSDAVNVAAGRRAGESRRIAAKKWRQKDARMNRRVATARRAESCNQFARSV